MQTYQKVSLGLIILLVIFLPAHFMQNPQTERDQQLFVYGTLLNPVVRSLVCHCLVGGEPAVLSYYQKRGRNIIPDETASVTGEIVMVSQWELEQIDQYENIPHQYRRVAIELDDEPTWVYLKNE